MVESFTAAGKRRGRPPKVKPLGTISGIVRNFGGSQSDDSGLESPTERPGGVIDPATLNGRGDRVTTERASSEISEPKAKRGRPSTTLKEKPPVSPETVGEWTDLLLAIHTGVATLTAVPELELDPDEAEKLSRACANVARHYALPTMLQKTKDWTTLGIVIVGTYGARIGAYRIRTADERAKARQAEAIRRAASIGQPMPRPVAAPAAPPAPPAPPAPRPNGGRFPDRPPSDRAPRDDLSLDVRMVTPEGGFT